MFTRANRDSLDQVLSQIAILAMRFELYHHGSKILDGMPDVGIGLQALIPNPQIRVYGDTNASIAREEISSVVLI